MGTTSCYVVSDLCSIHQRQKKSKILYGKDMFRVLVAQEGCVYRDIVEETMTVDGRKKKNKKEEDHDESNNNCSLPNHPLDINYDNENNTASKQIPWDTSLLLLIPLRLGLKSIPSPYHTQLAQIFTLPQSVGCIGGSPRHALWFYGSLLKQQDKKSHLFALDPHTVQMAPKRSTNNKKKIILSNEYLSSVTYNSSKPILIDMNKMDPSLALGFYIKDRNDFIQLQHTLQEKIKSSHLLFNIMDAKPDYTCNVSLLADMMISSSNSTTTGCCTTKGDVVDNRIDNDNYFSDDDVDVEDDYVFL